MPLQIRCPNPECRRMVTVATAMVGKEATCPGCGHPIQVVDPNEQTMPSGPKPVSPGGLATAPLAGKTLGNFEILKKLGEGGMASVYRARNLKLQKDVALKVIPTKLVQSDPELGRRFVQEARAAAKLEHPNIVPVHSIDVGGGYFFIEMQLVDGESLAHRLRRERTLCCEEALRIAAEVAKALGFAHGHGIIHRDVKPANILLMKDGTVKVSDFGLAKVMQAGTQLTVEGQILGTASYMSPEQCVGLETDSRSDIYSLGATLFEMLTGRPPFVGENPLSILLQHREAPTPSPQRFVADVPDEVCAVVLKMLSKKPQERYQSCEELRKALLRAQKGHMAEAEEQFPKAIRQRHRAGKSLAVVVTTGFVLIGIGLGARGLWRRSHPPVTRPRTPAWQTAKVAASAPKPAAEAPANAPKQEKAPAPPDGAERVQGIAQERTEGAPAPPSPAVTHPPATPSCDGVYVATSGSGEKIPHPLSRKTATLLCEGEKIETPEGMRYIPAGAYLMGSKESGEWEGFVQREVELDAFFIDKYEVTNSQYKEFVEATHAILPRHWADNGGRIPEGRENHPVVCVPWEDAATYAKWCGRRLPTEAEWEKAAGWDAKAKRPRRYPWGDESDPERANHCRQIGCPCKGNWEKHANWMRQTLGVGPMEPPGTHLASLAGNTAPVGKFSGDVSFFGCYDMGGNVREWVNDWYNADYYKTSPKKNPRGPTIFEAESLESEQGQWLGKCRVLRGGCWSHPRFFARTSARDRIPPITAESDIGFRCALDAPLSKEWHSSTQAEADGTSPSAVEKNSQSSGAKRREEE